MSYYNLGFTGKDYGKKLPIEMVLDDTSSYHTKNLLKIPSNELDDIINNYFNDNEMEHIIELLHNSRNKYYENINSRNVNNETNAVLDIYEQENINNKKRNYEKYYYVDGDVKKGHKKRLFRK